MKGYRSKRLVLMMGLPYSGKSTAALILSDILDAPIVCPDEIRKALHGERFVKRLEPMVWFQARIMVRALFQAGHDYVVLDATNCTRERRDEWRGPENWRVQVYEVAETQFTCLERAKDAGDDEILPVIRRMASGYERLHRDEEELIVEIPEARKFTESEDDDGEE